MNNDSILHLNANLLFGNFEVAVPGKHVHKIHTPYTPLIHVYSKIGVYRGIHNFLNFALKHRLWVLVRTASLRRS